MTPDIIEFITDPQLLNLNISAAQETLQRAIYGLPLSSDQTELFCRCTGRQKAPGAPFAEATVIAGARAGKDSRIAAPIVIYERARSTRVSSAAIPCSPRTRPGTSITTASAR